MLDTKALAEATAIIVREHVDAAVAPLLKRIATLEGREAAIPTNGRDGADGRNGIDGKDADPELIRSMVQEAIASIPLPKDGDDGRDGKDGENGKDGADGRDGKDGVGLAGMMIDRSGEAVVTLTDGTMVKLGPVVGRDGRDGKDGERGADGRDGQDLTDIEVVQDGATVEFTFKMGETWNVYQITLPHGPAGADGKDAYAGEARGLFDPAATYRKMDVVSLNGCEWRAKQDQPGDCPGPGWMLTAQKGKRGDRGERGLNGSDGVSPVAQYVRGEQLITTLSDGSELKADLSALIPAEAA